MRLLFTVTCFIILSQLSAQTTADFENFDMSIDTFKNGIEGSGGFESGEIWLPNFFEDIWGSWTGWAISSVTDNQTAGFGNQYSAIPGKGFDQSDTYATSFVSGESQIKILDGLENRVAIGAYFTNATYAYLSMLEGDAFAKKFGGETGDDPDFFLMTIKKYLDGNLSTDSINFYLADFRFEDNSQDYIINEWTYIDLRELGYVDSLSITLSSSDVGAFGMNTPAYFCMDNVTTEQIMTSAEDIEEQGLVQVYPNPAQEKLYIDCHDLRNQKLFIYNTRGQLLISKIINQDHNYIDVRSLDSGYYFGRINNGGEPSQFTFIKH